MWTFELMKLHLLGFFFVEFTFIIKTSTKSII